MHFFQPDNTSDLGESLKLYQHIVTILEVLYKGDLLPYYDRFSPFLLVLQ